jgi:hypothetical protein
MSDKDGSIFGSTPESSTEDQVASNQQEVNKAEASSNDPYADLLKTIQSEDGRPKYATVSDAINSIPHAQNHISTLENELKEMREKMEELARERQELAEARHLENQHTQQDAQFGEDQVVGLVDEVLSRREKEQIQRKNVSTVVDSLTGKFGSTEAADKAYRAKAQEMGISLDMMNSLAMHSPNAVLAYFGTTGSSAPSKTEGSINTASMSSQPNAPKGSNPLLSGSMKDMQAEWDRIKKELGH